MANTIDSGQPLHNPRPNPPISSSPEGQAAAPVPKERGPLGAAAQNYLQQARQDVADIRQLGTPQKPT